MSSTILSIDPGKYRSGMAVLLEDGSVLERAITKTIDIKDSVSALCFKYQPSLIIIGNSGQGKSVEKKISQLNLKSTIIFVNEKGSTMEARKLYWEENKPKGILRFIPKSLLIPKEPYDDYAAVVIALFK